MITLTSSYGSVQLPNPILGDSEQLNIFTVFQVAMNKDVHTTKKTAPHSRLLLNFVDVKKSIFESLKTWYQNSRGMTVTYTDYASATWTGILVTNTLEINVKGRKDCTPYLEVVDFTIELEAIIP